MQSDGTEPIEEWRAISGFEGQYSVSSLGRVKSHLKSRGISERILKPYPVRGYFKVDFGWCGDTRSTFYVARLVAAAFLPKDEGRTYVNHKNGNPTDNRLENLEWCSNSENLRHSYRILGRKPISLKGIQNPLAKLTDDKVREFRKMRDDGVAIRQITRISGLDRRTIQMMLRKKSWSHVD